VPDNDRILTGNTGAVSNRLRLGKSIEKSSRANFLSIPTKVFTGTEESAKPKWLDWIGVTESNSYGFTDEPVRLTLYAFAGFEQLESITPVKIATIARR
jgi:hypothetical protein